MKKSIFLISNFSSLIKLFFVFIGMSVFGNVKTVSVAGSLLNNECDIAIVLPVNATSQCTDVVSVTFAGATASPQPVCSGTNGADIWFRFTAESVTHVVALTNFTILNSNAQPVVLSLYGSNDCANLGNPLYCSFNNAINATGLIPGNEYIMRASLNTAAPNLATGFDICISTPEIGGGGNPTACLVATVNFDFEEPSIGLNNNSFFNHNAVLGWRTTASDQLIEFWSSGFQGIMAYSGNQFIELNANIVSGVYQDYVSPEGTVFNYGFAHRGRLGTDTCQLRAGPPGGPYVAVGLPVATGNTSWSYNQGAYTVPAGQPVTRFIFESISSTGGASIGNFLDAISFTANTGILTPSPLELGCDNPMVTVEAVGAGNWIAHTTNPSPTVIADAGSNTTTISGFTVPGEYYFDWSTPFCNNTLVIQFLGGDVPAPIVVDIEYCEGSTAVALTAETLPEHTLNWYADAEGETALSEAPVPNTNEIGTSTYYVSQSNENGCESPLAPLTVTVHPLVIPVAEFDYETLYCSNQANIFPTLAPGFTAGGVFSATGGLVIDADTGEFNVSESPSGTYTVTYTFTGGDTCMESRTYSDTFSIVRNVSFALSGKCVGTNYIVSATPAEAISGEEISYIWSISQEVEVVTNIPTFNVTEFINNNLGYSFPLQIQLTVNSDGCENVSSYWVENIHCGIPKGISPNSDGFNDSFDLSHLQVDRLSIFNRYGMQVYQSKNYTSEWSGQADNGKELPDGTYYYVVDYSDGRKTGWVYINR